MATSTLPITFNKPNGFTDKDKEVFNNKIGDLNNFFQELFKTIIEKFNTNETPKKIATDFYRTHSNDIDNLCIGRPIDHPDNSITCKIIKKPEMITEQKLARLIYNLARKIKEIGITKMEKFKDTTTGKINIEKMAGGNLNNSYLNIRDILLDNRLANNIGECNHNMQKKPHCEYCLKWQNNRIMLRQLLFDLLSEDNYETLLVLIHDNVELFPAGILDQDQFGNFYILLNEYIESKK